MPTNVFSNSTLNPENIGFCGKHNNKCLGNGVLNISKCIGGVSTFISQPHFLNADSKFRENLNGLIFQFLENSLAATADRISNVGNKQTLLFQRHTFS